MIINSDTGLSVQTLFFAHSHPISNPGSPSHYEHTMPFKLVRSRCLHGAMLNIKIVESDSDSDSDKFIQQKYIQVPCQVYMSFLEIQITL